MSALERRFRDSLLHALLPGGERLPGAAAADLDGFFAELDGAAPPLLRLGWRASVFALTLSPLFLLGRLALFPSLDPDAKDELLTLAARSRFYVVRQLVQTLKLLGCLALLRLPQARGALDAGRSEDASRADAARTAEPAARDAPPASLPPRLPLPQVAR